MTVARLRFFAFASLAASATFVSASPAEAKFMQVDPIGYKDQVNLYAYVGNDPVNRADPTGNEQCPGVQGGCPPSVVEYAQNVREAATLSNPTMTKPLQDASIMLGRPGEGQEFTIDPKATPANFDFKDKTIHINPEAVSDSKVGGAYVAHELDHSVHNERNGELKSGADRMNMEVNAYSTQNQYNDA